MDGGGLKVTDRLGRQVECGFHYIGFDGDSLIFLFVGLACFPVAIILSGAHRFRVKTLTSESPEMDMSPHNSRNPTQIAHFSLGTLGGPPLVRLPGLGLVRTWARFPTRICC